MATAPLNIPVDIAFRATNAYGWPRIAIVVFGIDALGRDALFLVTKVRDARALSQYYH